MSILLVLLAVLFFVALLLVAGMQPRPAEYSIYELERRAKRSERAKKALYRQNLMPDVAAVLRVKTAILLVLTVILSIVAFGWFLGIVISIFVAIFYSPLAHVRPMARVSSKIYDSLEPHLLKAIQKAEPVFVFLRDTPLYDSAPGQFSSREELQELIAKSQEALSENERKIVASALAFGDKKVSDSMTPRRAVDSIKKAEFLGPLVLDELHSLGHSRLPVIDEDIDHVVGILYLRDLLSLDQRHSATAEEIMEKKVYYIHRDDTLEHALAAFLKTHHHLFIVINDERETVGILSLEDTLEALIGRRILDEDDNHADPRDIAARKNTNNKPSSHVDL